MNKLYRKQDLNVFFQVYGFRTDRKTKMVAPASWLAVPFSFSPLKPLNRIQRNAAGNKISKNKTLVFLCPRIEWSGAYCFCPVCLFVCLLSTLTFAITFEPLEVETSYLASTLHEKCPFNWHQSQWPCDLDFDLCAKNSFFGLCCRRGHSQCFTNTPWFFLITCFCTIWQG